MWENDRKYHIDRDRQRNRKRQWERERERDRVRKKDLKIEKYKKTEFPVAGLNKLNCHISKHKSNWMKKKESQTKIHPEIYWMKPFPLNNCKNFFFLLFGSRLKDVQSWKAFH